MTGDPPPHFWPVIVVRRSRPTRAGVSNIYSGFDVEDGGNRRIDALNNIEKGHVCALGRGNMLQRIVNG